MKRLILTFFFLSSPTTGVYYVGIGTTKSRPCTPPRAKQLNNTDLISRLRDDVKTKSQRSGLIVIISKLIYHRANKRKLIKPLPIMLSD